MNIKPDANLLYNFEEALSLLKTGNKMQNQNWNGKNMYLECQFPDENSKMTLPYIYMVNANGDRVPWLASQMDLFSGGWCIAK